MQRRIEPPTSNLLQNAKRKRDDEAGESVSDVVVERAIVAGERKLPRLLEPRGVL
jgi:hypothetical protein